MSGALLDSSVVAVPRGSTGTLPEHSAVSVVTLGELHGGVLSAPDEAVRDHRERVVEAVSALFEPIEVDACVAMHYGQVLAHARKEGRERQPMDLLIIATAAATGRTLITRDRKQAALARSFGVDVAEPS